MRTSRLLPLLMILLVLVQAPPILGRELTADDIEFMTEDYPPYSFVKDGQLQGLAVDLMGLMLKKLEARKTVRDIKVYPWARAYKTTLQTPNSCLFAMTETRERSRLFRFVGPIPKFDSAALFGKKSRNIRIQNYAQLKAYKIGVVRDDIAHVNLLENGISANLVLVSGTDSLARMLATDRIDLWAFGELSVATIFAQNGVEPKDFENVFRLQTGDSYFAFNRKTPDALVQKFQKAFDALVQEKKLKELMDRYVKNADISGKGI